MIQTMRLDNMDGTRKWKGKPWIKTIVMESCGWAFKTPIKLLEGDGVQMETSRCFRVTAGSLSGPHSGFNTERSSQSCTNRNRISRDSRTAWFIVLCNFNLIIKFQLWLFYWCIQGIIKNNWVTFTTFLPPPAMVLKNLWLQYYWIGPLSALFFTSFTPVSNSRVLRIILESSNWREIFMIRKLLITSKVYYIICRIINILNELNVVCYICWIT